MLSVCKSNPHTGIKQASVRSLLISYYSSDFLLCCLRFAAVMKPHLIFGL